MADRRKSAFLFFKFYKYMKVRFSLIMAIIGIVLASCGDDNDSEKWLTGKSQNFSINSNLRRETLPVLKARDVWTATVGYGTSDQGWLTLDKTEGEAGNVELTAFIAANTTKKYRSATVTVTCHKETVKFQFSQAGMTGGDEPKPSVSARVAKIEMTNFDREMNAVYEESLAFRYSGDVIVGADYHSRDKVALTESDVVVTIDRSQSGKCVYTMKETGMPDEVVNATLDDLKRIVSVGDMQMTYGVEGFLAKRTNGESTWLYDVDVKSNLFIVTTDKRLVYQFDPALPLRDDCNIDVNFIAMMTMTSRGMLKYAVLAEKGNFGKMLPYVIYKAASGKESYVFSPQIDSAKTLTSLDFAHRYNDLPYETQKRCVITYVD